MTEERGDKKAPRRSGQDVAGGPPEGAGDVSAESPPEQAEKKLEAAVLEIVEALRPALEGLTDDPSE